LNCRPLRGASSDDAGGGVDGGTARASPDTGFALVDVFTPAGRAASTILSSSALRAAEPGGGGGFVRGLARAGTAGGSAVTGLLRSAGGVVTGLLRSVGDVGTGVLRSVGDVVTGVLRSVGDVVTGVLRSAAGGLGLGVGVCAGLAIGGAGVCAGLVTGGGGASSGSSSDQPEARSAIRFFVSSPRRRRGRSSSGTWPTITCLNP
jgi:hypothetical protein